MSRICPNKSESNEAECSWFLAKALYGIEHFPDKLVSWVQKNISHFKFVYHCYSTLVNIHKLKIRAAQMLQETVKRNKTRVDKVGISFKVAKCGGSTMALLRTCLSQFSCYNSMHHTIKEIQTCSCYAAHDLKLRDNNKD
ncbi:hypothetical protein T07_13288 [Trichinella nelsoni]|uniref:Uncharacterized protein n=1 Tax=Trichinella nelsoni TaxID=6336 RepID=A0A0V0RLD2_9BILA|nr:hypothetical protein T07_13288 [Trichinella nelsoni]